MITVDFQNNSNNDEPINIVVYTKNEQSSFDSLELAWVVFKNSGQGDGGTITYPTSGFVQGFFTEGGATQHTKKIPVDNGKLYKLWNDPDAGTVIVEAGSAGAGDEVDVKNGLSKGEISVTYFKGQDIDTAGAIATIPKINPDDKAVFELLPKLYFAVASNITRGDVLNSADLTDPTQIDLLNVVSCTVELTGGGGDPYEFKKTHVKKGS